MTKKLFIVWLLATFAIVTFTIGMNFRESRFRVVGPSMAPAYLGPHFSVVCQRCSFSSSFDASSGKIPDQVVCANCGFQGNSTENAVRSPGDILDVRATDASKIRRWDAVVITAKQDPSYCIVKRIAFLPGETPLICRGELYRGRRMIRKSTSQREKMKVLVYDQSFEDKENPRFIVRGSSMNWSLSPGRIVYDRRDEKASRLVYEHRNALPLPSIANQSFAPLDGLGYNHSVSRTLAPVRDLWLDFRLNSLDADRFLVHLTGEKYSAAIEFNVEKGQISLVKKGASTQTKWLDPDLIGRTIRVGLCDGHYFVEVESREKRTSYQLGKATVRYGKHPFELEFFGNAAEILDLKVYRDIVWLPPSPRKTLWRADTPLGSDEYFLLGDNQAISNDSRHEMGAVQLQSQLNGIAFRVLAER